VQQGLQRTGRAIAQAQLQPAAREQEKDKHRERVEVDFTAECASGLEGPGRADQKGDQDAQRHRQIHADLAAAQVTPGLPEEGAA
jgi:hypothetical protein